MVPMNKRPIVPSISGVEGEGEEELLFDAWSMSMVVEGARVRRVDVRRSPLRRFHKPDYNVVLQIVPRIGRIDIHSLRHHWRRSRSGCASRSLSPALE